MTMIEKNMDLECFELSFPAILLFILALLEVIKIVIYSRRFLRRVKITSPNQESVISTELKTLEWWISGLMLNPLFFLILRLNIACSPLIFNLQINYPIRIKDIPF